MEKKIVAIIAGGDSTEREISIKGAINIFSVIDRELFVPYIVYLSKSGWYVKEGDNEFNIDKNDFSAIVNGVKVKFEYALINIHGTPGENGILQSYFELVGVPYSTCGVCASALTFDKVLTKRAVSSLNVKMAKDVVIDKGDVFNAKEIIKKLGLPIFVKPCAAGSSFGVSMVKKSDELSEAIEKAYSEGDRVLIEEAICGVEISCGVMILDGQETLFPATEIVSEKEFFDYEAKYQGFSKEITPARISDNVRTKLNTILIDIYKTLNLRGLVRIDFIIKDEEPYLIEINTVPGMSAQSIIPQQARHIGMSLTDMFTKIIKHTS